MEYLALMKKARMTRAQMIPAQVVPAYIDNGRPRWKALFKFIDQTIEMELARELAFLANYDETKKVIQEIVDMPDRKIDLFIRFCLQNNGRLSARKRTSHFDFLSDEEIARMEQAVLAAYGNRTLNDD